MTRVARCLSAGGFCLLLLSCSEGPGTIPQGGVRFTTGSSASVPSGKSCPTPGYTVAIGEPAPDMFNDDPGKTLPDGVRDTSVSCTVKGRDNVTFSASIRGRNTSDNLPAELRLTGGTIGPDGTGTANVSLVTPINASAVGNIALQSETPCTITGVSNGDGDQFGDGVLWARFTCSAMTSSRQPSAFCRTEGVVVFKNCDH